MRTHGRKNGYVTEGQEERLRRWLPEIGLGREQRLATAGYANKLPVVLEIGIGCGEFLAFEAVNHPEWNFLGAEIYLPGIAKAVSYLEEAGVMERIRITQLPAQFVLEHQVADGELHGAYINHPDPWPKARHHKRRIIQKNFAEQLVRKLEPGGFIKLASDIEELAIWMRDILDATPGLKNLGVADGFIPREEGRIVTKFEGRGDRAGRISRFMHYIKTGDGQ